MPNHKTQLVKHNLTLNTVFPAFIAPPLISAPPPLKQEKAAKKLICLEKSFQNHYKSNCFLTEKYKNGMQCKNILCFSALLH